MKTILILSFLAALAAFAVSLISLEVAGTLLLGAGLLAIMKADYSRRDRVLNSRRTPVLHLPRARDAQAAALGLAA